ncbi:MAG: ABC transporter permease, partial [Pseudomonadota bacterium]
VVMMGKLDISVGSIAFVAMAAAAMLMEAGWSPVPACLVGLVVGAALGAVNGFIVTVLKVNPLIATLGAMIAYRGLALQITDSQVIVLPDAMRGFGNWTIGPVFVDILLAAVILVAVHVLHRDTRFGRDVTAIGNDEATARRLGLPVTRTVFWAFVLSGFLAAIGGVFAAAQVGSVTTFLGRGLEFTAVAVVVVGGISLFGGRGSVFWGVLLGALTFEVIRSGLNHVGADPYFYQLIGGAVIFVAMYAAALKAPKGGALG